MLCWPEAETSVIFRALTYPPWQQPTDNCSTNLSVLP